MLPEIYKVRRKYSFSDGNGGASLGRTKRYPSGSARTAPLKTFRFQRGPVLRSGKLQQGKDVLCAWILLRGGTATPKASPERGGARKAGGGVRPPRRKVAAGEGRALRVKPFKGRSPCTKSLP